MNDLKKFLLCRPSFFNISYEINPWMKLSHPTNQSKVTEQWNTLCDRIEEFGGSIVNLKPRESLPDMVFTANAGLYIRDKNLVILSNFKHEERQKEQFWFYEAFAQLKIQIFLPLHTYEGAGDSLFLNNVLIGGYGFRSDKEVYDEFKHLLNEIKIVKLVDSRFYHLDTCFCPFDDGNYLIFPGAFEDEGLDFIRSVGNTEIIVPEHEALNFACNAVQIGKKIILPINCPQTCKLLEDMGYEPVELNMSEFMKSGGACKCLTLAI